MADGLQEWSQAVSYTHLDVYKRQAGGSMGAGDLSELVKKLLEGTAQEKILVICGSNRKAEQKLKKEFCKPVSYTHLW